MAAPRRKKIALAPSPFREAGAGGLFEKIRTEEELAELVLQTARAEQRPYAKLLRRLAGAPAGLDEASARDTWIAAVARRRDLAEALKRPVHLQVALFDLLHHEGASTAAPARPPEPKAARPAPTRRASVSIKAPKLDAEQRRRSTFPPPPAPTPLAERPVVVFATANARLFEDVHTALGRRGFPVLPARDAKTALALTGLSNPRVLLVDVLLPPRGGTRLLTRLPPSATSTHRLVVLPEGWFAMSKKLAKEVEALVLPFTDASFEGKLAAKLGQSFDPIAPLDGQRQTMQLVTSVASLCDLDARRRAPLAPQTGRAEIDLVARWLGA